MADYRMLRCWSGAVDICSPKKVILLGQEGGVELSWLSIPMWLITGVFLVLVAFFVVNNDRRMAGLPVVEVWQKVLGIPTGLAIVVTSFLVIGIWEGLGLIPSVNNPEEFSFREIAMMSTGTAVVFAVLLRLGIYIYRKRRPILASDCHAIEILNMMARCPSPMMGRVYRTSDSKLGLLVWRDLWGPVLTPPISYYELDIGDEIRDGRLGDVVKKIGKVDGELFFSDSESYIEVPGVCVGATPLPGVAETREVLRFVKRPPNRSSAAQ